jgi:hypothetical protein
MASQFSNFGNIAQARTGLSIVDLLTKQTVSTSGISQIQTPINIGGVLQNPGTIFLPPIQFPPIVQPTPTPTTPTPAPTPAPTTPADLVLPILAIPIAYEGQPITSEYHNSTRNAILAIAGQLGAGAVGQLVTRSFAPGFFPDGSPAGWQPSLGVASKPTNATDFSGWFPVQLPDNSRIEGFAVLGRRVGAMTSFRVRLLRQALADHDPAGGPTQLITVALVTHELKDAQADFSATSSLNIAGLSAGALEEFKMIDNSKFKYLVQATVAGAAADAEAQVSAVQVFCRQS